MQKMVVKGQLTWYLYQTPVRVLWLDDEMTPCRLIWYQYSELTDGTHETR